jgi:hypothetical protein
VCLRPEVEAERELLGRDDVPPPHVCWIELELARHQVDRPLAHERGLGHPWRAVRADRSPVRQHAGRVDGERLPAVRTGQ